MVNGWKDFRAFNSHKCFQINIIERNLKPFSMSLNKVLLENITILINATGSKSLE
jgi:hypothetical protein